MENAILQTAVSQGIWAVLFVYLLVYVLKQNHEREKKYQDILDKYAKRFDTIENGIDELLDRTAEYKQPIKLRVKKG